MMRVIVDVNRCEGHGRCQAIAPEVFELDRDAVSTVRLDPVPAQFRARALDGVGACPVAALTAIASEEGEET